MGIKCWFEWWEDSCFLWNHSYHMGCDTRKSVFGIFNRARFKPVSSASETTKKIEIPCVASLHIKPSKKRITKALISLCGWAGWSAPVLFANLRRQVFSRRGPYDVVPGSILMPCIKMDKPLVVYRFLGNVTKGQYGKTVAFFAQKRISK